VPNPPRELEPFLAEAEQYAMTDYALALSQGDNLSTHDRHAVATRLHDFIGLPVDYIEKADLRIDGGMFAKTLLENEGLTIGRLDSRYAGPTIDPMSKEAGYDPQSAAVSSAYVSAYNDYARSVLGFPGQTDYKSYIELEKICKR
jgi:carboxypeptidase C (cathepsin A)